MFNLGSVGTALQVFFLKLKPRSLFPFSHLVGNICFLIINHRLKGECCMSSQLVVVTNPAPATLFNIDKD